MRIPATTKLFIALWFVCGACSPRDPNLIVPGERVGSYKLHQPESKIRGGNELEAYARQISKGLLISYEGNQVSVISVFSTNYHTDRGLKLGSSVNDVIACYGEPDLRTNGFMVYEKLGIQFHALQSKVGMINVLDKK